MTDITNKDLTPDGKLKQQYPDTTGYFSCSGTNIRSLVGVPQKVGDYFVCSYTKIASLIGAPLIVGGNISLSNTKIVSLQGIGKDYLKEIGQYLFLNECSELKSNMLGLIMVKKLKGLDFNSVKEVENIFNKHLEEDRDLLDCKEELMNGGYKEFAKL